MRRRSKTGLPSSWQVGRASPELLTHASRRDRQPQRGYNLITWARDLGRGISKMLNSLGSAEQMAAAERKHASGVGAAQKIMATIEWRGSSQHEVRYRAANSGAPGGLPRCWHHDVSRGRHLPSADWAHAGGATKVPAQKIRLSLDFRDSSHDTSAEC